MASPLINVLIRTSNRPDEFRRCFESIIAQTYRRINPIVCTDKRESLQYIGKYLNTKDVINVTPTGIPFHWNFYCNNLKERVTDGWFFYLDDDDFLHNPRVLERIAPHLNDPRLGIICQFNRGVHPKPVFDILSLYRSDNSGVIDFNGFTIETNTIGTFLIKPIAIERGKIGGSCIFLHHSQKSIANWDGHKAADYRFIRDVAEKIPLKWVPQVVVQAGNKGRKGK